MTSSEERARCDAVCAQFNDAPYYRHLGIVAKSERPGTALVTLPFKIELTQLYGGVHGGALLSLADSAISVALATTFEHGEMTATVDIAMQFLAPVGQHDVVAEGVVTQRGGRLSFGECVLRAGGRDVARAHGICYVRSPAP